MEENGEDSHAMQSEENLEESKENHDAEEDAELEDVPKNGKNLKKRGRKKGPSGGQGTPKKPESKETPKKPEGKEPVTPASDRPARERKSIDRFADSVEKEREKPKEFRIEQGAGSCLRDIPNVVFKLSKRKSSDESVQLLHKLLYNKKVKPYQVKSNILQFSGCVWGPNEEKEKSKMKDKLEKCVKDNLLQVSDLLDLNITKLTKKEDLVLRVLEFMDCPHKTTEKLLEEAAQKSKEKKRGKTPSKGKRKKSSGQTPRKRQKPVEANEETEPDADEEGENQDDVEEEPEEVPEEEPEEEPEEAPVKKKSIKIKEPRRDPKPNSGKKLGKKLAKKPSEPEDEEEEEEPEEQAEEPEEDEEVTEEPKRKRSKNKKYEEDVASRSPKKSTQKSDVLKSPKKGAQRSAKPESVYEPREEDLDDDIKGVKSKPLSKVTKTPSFKEAKTVAGSATKEKKKASTGSSKASSKKSKEEQEEVAPPVKVPKKARGTNNAEAKEVKSTSVPPDEDLRAAICELLRDADFSTVTFTDVVKQLGAKFDVDLSQNKAHVKNLIQEEISKIVDEDDGEGENEEAGISTPEKEEKESMAED